MFNRGHNYLWPHVLHAARQASLSIINSQSLLKLMSTRWVMLSNHLILCRPLLLTSIFPSIRVFSKESLFYIRWPKDWSFSFSISPSNEHSGLIFFRIDWFDLLAVQGTLKHLLQHHSSKASILWLSAFFTVLSLGANDCTVFCFPTIAPQKEIKCLLLHCLSIKFLPVNSDFCW